MKRRVTIICLALIALVFAGMFVFTVFFHTEESDNDLLTEMPEFTTEKLFSGDYFDKLMEWFTDHVPGRDKFFDFNARITSLYGLSEKEAVAGDDSDTEESEDESLNESAGISDESSEPEVSEDTSEPESIPDESSEAEVSQDEESSESSGSDPAGEQQEAEISKAILILKEDKRGLEIYYGNNKRAKQFAEVLNKLGDTLPDNVTLYSMVVPKACAYYIWQSEKYAKYAGRNKENIDTISEALNENVVDVSIYNTLGVHANEDIYFRTDHHWTPLGAYYASEVFCRTAGVAFDDISTFTRVEREGYVGTLYKYSDYNPILLNNPDDFIYYIPGASYTATYYNRADFTHPKSHDGGIFWDIPDSKRSSWYSTFIRGDSYAVKLVSDTCRNGRKLLLIKDSYGNALAPYLVAGFEEIYIVDARYYGK
ncbi:MAG: hypothetical protein J5793_01410, partial [Clostridia bacterium]|nr:hypothetical protein [Clostridia bacterium]